MRNVRTRDFRVWFALLPERIRRIAGNKYRLFRENPSHPSLHFEQVASRPGHWKVRVTKDYRAVCRRDGDTYVWYFIGKRADFDAKY